MMANGIDGHARGGFLGIAKHAGRDAAEREGAESSARRLVQAAGVAAIPHEGQAYGWAR